MRKKNTESKQNYDVLGVVLIMVSALSLLCLIFSGLFGVVSGVVSDFLRGAFGLFAYAMFSALLVLGVLLFRKRTITLKSRYILSMLCSLICVLAIVHLATSASLLGNSFADYAGSVYNSGKTCGGVMMSMFVYPIYLITSSQVFVYVIYGALLAVSLLALTDFRIFGYLKGDGSQKESSHVVTPKRAKATEHGDATYYNTGTGYKASGNSLYVGNIASQAEKPKKRGGGTALNLERAESPYATSGSFGTYSGTSTAGASGATTNHFGMSSLDQMPIGTSSQQPKTSSQSTNAQNDKYQEALRKLNIVGLSQQRPDQTSQFSSYYQSQSMYQPQFDQQQFQQQQQQYQAQQTQQQQYQQQLQAQQQQPQPQQPQPQQPQPQPEPQQGRGGFYSPDFSHQKPFGQSTIQRSVNNNADNPLRVPQEDTRKPPMHFHSTNRPTPNQEPAKPSQQQQRPTIYDAPARPYNKPPSTSFVQDTNPNNPIINGERVKPENGLFTGRPASKPEPKPEPKHDLPKQNAMKQDDMPKQNPFTDAQQPSDLPEKRQEQGSMSGILDRVSEQLFPKRETIDDKISRFENANPNLRTNRPKPNKSDESNSPLEQAMAENISVEKIGLQTSSKKYIFPPLDLLEDVVNPEADDVDRIMAENSLKLEQLLASFKVDAKVKSVRKAAQVTRYEIMMPSGIPVKTIEKYADDIAYHLAANGKVNIEAPIPGRTAIGIEVPNKVIDKIGIKDVLSSPAFLNAESPATFSLGMDLDGNYRVCEIDKCVHLLIAGTTGSGKSVCLNSLITSILYKASPEDVRMILIDPKYSEFAPYEGIPHLLTSRIITSTKHAVNAFEWAFKEMERRQKLITKVGLKTIYEYNESPKVKDGSLPKMPFLLLIVDELAQLMADNKKVFDEKVRLIAQKSRSSGLCLVLATQRPSVDIVTGTLKSNLPSRIAFAVASFPDSNTIINQGGAENLLGKGDMLFAPRDSNILTRIQGNYIDTKEINDVIDFVKAHNETVYDEEADSDIFRDEESAAASNGGDGDGEYDSRLIDAARVAIESKCISTSLVQRKLAIGYARAARIVDQLEKLNFISPFDGSSKPRTVYMTQDDFEDFFGVNY